MAKKKDLGQKCYIKAETTPEGNATIETGGNPTTVATLGTLVIIKALDDMDAGEALRYAYDASEAILHSIGIGVEEKSDE